MACGRYAPSPTGRLHLGNLRTALLAWLQTRLNNGSFILRIDDLDKPRSRPGSLAQIISDLHWIGLDWDEGPDIGGANTPYLQSHRIDQYQNCFEQLQNLHLVYPCVCSRKDVAQALSAPHREQPVSVYPGTCRPNSAQAKSNFRLSSVSIDGNTDYAWRFIVGNGVVEFKDKVLGDFHQLLDRDVGDFVVKRRDGLFAYQLASAVDDGIMSVTDIVRGADLIDSTPRQLTIVDKLKFPRPNFWHVPLLHDNTGQRLAKRNGAHSLQQWQEAENSAQQLIGYFASSLGLIDVPKPLSCQELLQQLDIKKFHRVLANQH